MAAFLSFESQAQKVADWLPYLDDCKKTVAIDPKTSAGRPHRHRGAPPDINLSQADFSVVFDPDEEPSPRGGTSASGSRRSRARARRRSSRSSPSATRPRATSSARRRPTPRCSISRSASRPAPSTRRRSRRSSRRARSTACTGATAARRWSRPSSRPSARGSAPPRTRPRGRTSSSASAAETTPTPPPDAPAEETPLASAPAWTESETLRQEKDTLGFYVSSHPFEEWADWTKVFCRLSCSTLKQQPQDKRVVLPALVQSVRTIVTKSGRSAGQKMGILMLEDTTGTAEAVMFSNVFGQFAHLVVSDDDGADKPVFVMGRVDHSRGDPQVIVDKLVPIDGQPLEKGRLLIALRGKRLNGTADAAMDRVRGLLIEHDPRPHTRTRRARERGRRRRGERVRPLRRRQRRGGGPLRPRRRDRVRLRHAEPRVQGPRPARPGPGQGTLHRPGPRVGPPARRRLGRGEQGRPAQVPAPAGVRRTRHYTARATAVPAVPREG
jgi:hypothetical protein